MNNLNRLILKILKEKIRYGQWRYKPTIIRSLFNKPDYNNLRQLDAKPLLFKDNSIYFKQEFLSNDDLRKEIKKHFAITIVNFLDKEKILDNFKANLYKYNGETINSFTRRYCASTCSFVDMAFNWASTVEGHDFWAIITQKTRQMLYDIYIVENNYFLNTNSSNT